MIDKPTVTVEISFATGVNPDAWLLDAGALDSTAILAPQYADVFTDVSADMRRLSIDRGKAREVDVFQAGRANINLDNLARDYDPTNLSGPYVSGGVTQVKPGRRIIVKATHPTTLVEYTLFTGFVWDWGLSYGRRSSGDAIARLGATDAMTTLARAPVAVTTSAGTSGIAAADVLDAAGIGGYNVASGDSTLQATAFDTNVLAALRTIEKSEQGYLYVDEYGVIIFDNRHALFEDSRSNTSQATFGAGNLLFAEPDPTYDSDLITNIVEAQRTGGTAQDAQDDTSIADYGQRKDTLTGLMNSTDTEVLGIAEFILGKWKDPRVRIASIVIEPQRHADLMTQALGRRLGDRVTVQLSPPGGGTISREVFIIGIKHDNDIEGPWRTTFTFEDAEWAAAWALDVGALDTTTKLLV